MCVFMYVVHGHCGPLGPYPGPHTAGDRVVGSHIFADPDGGLVGLVGSVVAIVLGGLDSSFVGAGGLCFFLPARASSGYLEGGEEEGAGHLVECGAARVFHPNGTIRPPMDTAIGALLYPAGVGDVGDRPDDRIGGTVVHLRGVGLGRGEGWAVAVLGELAGLGGGDGLHRPCGGGRGGGLGLFGSGDHPVATLVGRLDGKLSLLGGGWGAGRVRLRLAGGCFGAVVVDAPPPSTPSSPSLPPPPPMLPHIPSPPPPPAYSTSYIRAPSPGRKWHDVTQTPLTTCAVSRSWRPRKRARPRGGHDAV